LAEEVEVRRSIRNGLATTPKALDRRGVWQGLEPLLPPVSAAVSDVEDATDISSRNADGE
jgi:hypothetical protein